MLNEPDPIDMSEPVLNTTVVNDCDPLRVLSPILVTAAVKVTDRMLLQFCKKPLGTLTVTVKLNNNDFGHPHDTVVNVAVQKGNTHDDELTEPVDAVVYPIGQDVLLPPEQ